MQHVIKKQVIHLFIDRSLNAFDIQQKMSNDYKENILPLFDGIFDAICNDDEIISIDKLELNLGVLPSEEIDNGYWSERVVKSISDQLQDFKRGNYSKNEMVVKPVVSGKASQWIFYMQHGFLPWNVLKTEEEWYQQVLEAFATDSSAIYQLKNLIRNNSVALKRIVGQHPDHFLRSILETITAENQEELPGLIRELSVIFFDLKENKKQNNLFTRSALQKKVWEEAFDIAIDSELKLKSGEIVALLLENHFAHNQVKPKSLKLFLKKNRIELVTYDQTPSEKFPSKNRSGKSIPMKKVEQPAENGALLSDGIFVVNAGIVLLHPFLPLFFKNVKLVKDNRFADSFSMLKAMTLLHFLAAGKDKPEEHELVIPKILCGYALEETVATDIELHEKDLQEAESLLRSAIEQWSVLQNTSPQGLREGFLQRNGKLFMKNDGSFLQVEQGAIDVLLDYVPWNLSIIKLPWVKNILKVEWR